MPIDDYARALQLIGLASEHALQGNHDTARTVLRSALMDGNLHRNDRLAGRLHYQAVLALIDIREGKVTPAVAELTKVLNELRRVNAKARPDVLARCYQVMMVLPHVRQIHKQLEAAKSSWMRRDYVKAYQKIRDAKRLQFRNSLLTPPTTSEAISQATAEAMIHLMENHSPKEAIAITADLQKRGLIERS